MSIKKTYRPARLLEKTCRSCIHQRPGLFYDSPPYCTRNFPYHDVDPDFRCDGHQAYRPLVTDDRR